MPESRKMNIRGCRLFIRTTLVQKIKQDLTNGNGSSVTFTSPNNAGDAIIVFGYWVNSANTASISDSSTNAYIPGDRMVRSSWNYFGF
jgi:hypothetical protein